MKILIGILILLLPFAITAKEAENYKDSQGYVEFGSLDSIYGEPKVEINLGGALLNLVGKISKHEDPELGEVIRNLDQVRVLVYELDETATDALNLVDKISATLKAKQWIPIVSVNEDHEKVRIYMHQNNDIVDGMVVMFVDATGNNRKKRKEAVFINIVGEINPEQLSQLTDSLDIGVNI
ncbi:MAG: hypothetical protein ACI92E_002238 [Oceanicoccus sp.]|jgi:hypothetical protein